MVKIVVSMALVSILLLGCGQTAQGTASESTPIPIPVPTPASNEQPPESPPGKHIIETGKPIPKDRPTGISPDKVVIGNIETKTIAEAVEVTLDKRYYPGYRPIVVPLQIHNGEGEERLFSVRFKVPDTPKEGFAKAPEYAKDWVQISDEKIKVGTQETKEVYITFQMPKGAEIFASHWEFWIHVKDISQTTQVQTAYNIRWLIEMRL